MEHKSEKEINALTKEKILDGIKNNDIYFSDITEQWWGDVDIVKQAVIRKGYALEFAPVKITNNKETMITLLKENSDVVKYASKRLKNDRDFSLAVIENCPHLIFYLSEKITGNRELMLMAVEKNGNALQNVSAELKQDKELVLAAMKNNVDAFYYSSHEIKNDREVVKIAIEKNFKNLKMVSDKFKGDRELVSLAVSQNALALFEASKELQNDIEFLRILKKQEDVESAPQEYKDWLIERAATLEVLEEDEWMRKNNKLVNQSMKPRKF